MDRKLAKLAVLLLAAALMAAMIPAALAVDPHEHKWGNWEDTTPATCEGYGEQKRYCQVSGCSEFETRKTEPTGHRFSEWQITSAPGCTTTGTESRYCLNGCGKTETRTVPEKGHNWNAWYPTTQAKCDTDGEETRTCANGCGQKETRTIPKLGHQYSWRETKRATCSVDGEREGTCIRCGDKKTETIPNFGGKNQANGHTFGAWIEPESNKTATCKQEIVKIRTCSACGREEVQSLGKGKHVARTNKKGVAMWYWKPKPTLVQEGRKVQVCANCGKVMKSVKAKIEGAQYNVPVTGFGPRAATVNPMLAASADRLIPVDFTNQDEQVFPLVTDSNILVGQIKVNVMDETVSISYEMNDPQTIVSQASLMLFPDAKTLTTADLQNMGNMRRFGEPIALGGQTFGVIVARMVVNFTTSNPANRSFPESGIYLDGVTSNATILQEMTANLMQ